MQFLTTKEFAKYENKTVPTINEKLKKGTLRSIRKKKIKTYRHIIPLELAYYKKFLTKKRVISIVNHKGGVGKTTIVTNLAHSLAFLEKKVLIIDLDPQANATYAISDFNKNENGTIIDFQKTTKELLELAMKNKPSLDDLKEFIQEKNFENAKIDLIPSSIKLATIIREIESSGTAPFIMKRILKDLRKEYDYILIDTPPSFGALMSMSLMNSNYALIVMEADPFSFQGASDLINEINLNKDNMEAFNDEILDIFGFIVNKISLGNLKKDYLEIIHRLSKIAGVENVFTVSNSIKVQEAQSEHLPILEYMINSQQGSEILDIAYLLINKDRIDE